MRHTAYRQAAQEKNLGDLGETQTGLNQEVHIPIKMMDTHGFVVFSEIIGMKT